jgi:hypothetical protein
MVPQYQNLILVHWNHTQLAWDGTEIPSQKYGTQQPYWGYVGWYYSTRMSLWYTGTIPFIGV